MSTLVIRQIEQMADLVAAEQLQREVWGINDLDIVPAAQLRAAAHAGGHVIGAYRGAELVGFAYAMVALAHGRGMSGTGLHSHMVAVSANERGAGIGRSLKWFQRRLALAQGLPWITWTFDPLQARNAKLNLEHLGAVSHDYLVDFYGAMPGPLGGGQASDRLLALWLLDSPRVRRLAAAQQRPKQENATSGLDAFVQAGLVTNGPASSSPDPLLGEEKPTADRIPLPAAPGSWLLGPEDVVKYRAAGHESLREAVVKATHSFKAQPGSSAAEPGTTGFAKVAAPRNATALLARDPELAALWRSGVRAAMTEGLNLGLVVVGFQDDAYILGSQT